ncbi:MAG: hypothetical protein BWY42_01716 [Candidatus Omnitrophica bacterium ADurb.Bin277]|nr:MAG: hypothetical protein BWY42_01716 [Candidatus Omnitrophica bacterium ADurb.Bin277]
MADIIRFGGRGKTDFAFVSVPGIIARRQKTGIPCPESVFGLRIKKIPERDIKFRIPGFIHIDQRPEHLEGPSVKRRREFDYPASFRQITPDCDIQSVKRGLILGVIRREPNHARAKFVEQAVYIIIVNKLPLPGLRIKSVSTPETFFHGIIKSRVSRFLGCQDRVSPRDNTFPQNRHIGLKRKIFYGPEHTRKADGKVQRVSKTVLIGKVFVTVSLYDFPGWLPGFVKDRLLTFNDPEKSDYTVPPRLMLDFLIDRQQGFQFFESLFP